NDPNFNCDVYFTLLDEKQTPNNTESQKQSAWKLFDLEKYKQLAEERKTTPTHTTYYKTIIQKITPKDLNIFHQTECAQDALFGEAQIYDQPVNILIDSGAIGCIISKHFLDSAGKQIDAPANIKIIDINGKRTSPLGIVYQVPIRIGEIETPMDMIVTESREYNVLLGNIWLKLVKANINYNNETMNIEYQGQQHTMPITCTQRLDPKQYTVINPQNELELEKEDEDDEAWKFNYLKVTKEKFEIDDRIYPRGLMEHCNNALREGCYSRGPGKCLCQILEEGETCHTCNQTLQDYTIYQATEAGEEKTNQQTIYLEKDREIPVGKLDSQQLQVL